MPEISALIALLIVDRPLCVDCIAGRANVPVSLAAGYLNRMRNAVAGYHEHESDRCRACGTIDKVYSLTRPAL